MLPWVEAWARPAALAVLAGVVPWRCSFVVSPLEPSDSAPSAAQRKEEVPAARVSSAPPSAPPAERVEAIALPEEVVFHAIAAGQSAFLRCWARAQRTDPMEIAAKVRMRLEVDAAGKVTAVASDSESPVLSRCLAVVARQLPFPAPGRPVVVELPLIFH
jgi:hypothetical protein